MVDWRGSRSPRRMRDSPPGVRPASREARFWLMPCRDMSAARPGSLDCDASSMSRSVAFTMRHVKPYFRNASQTAQAVSLHTPTASAALRDIASGDILRRVKSQDLVQAMRRLSRMDGYTQESLSAASGVSRVTISRWFTAKAEPDLENFLKVAGAARYTLARLEDEIRRFELARKGISGLAVAEREPEKPAAEDEPENDVDRLIGELARELEEAADEELIRAIRSEILRARSSRGERKR